MRTHRRRRRLSAVFLDRDGVVNRKAPEGEYVTRWADFVFLPGSLEGLRLLAAGGVPVVIITNQRGIARGHMTEGDLADIHNRMLARIADTGGRIDAVYYCPHEGGCDCRKPGSGLFKRAADELAIELEHSAVLGDRASDVEAARRIGALAVAVNPVDAEGADYVSGDLLEAARWLSSRSRAA